MTDPNRGEPSVAPSCVDFFQSEDVSATHSERLTAGSYGLTLVRATKGAGEAYVEETAQFTINACMSGTCELVLDLGDGPRVHRDIPPQTINILPPYTSADVTAHSATTTLTAAFTLNKFQPLLDRYNLGAPTIGRFYGRATPCLQAIQLLQKIWRLAMAQDPSTAILVDATTLQLLALLSGEPDLSPIGSTHPEDTRIGRTIDYIEAYLSDALTVAKIADVACLSPGHFSRSFKATTGEPVWAYVQRRRGERAKELLLTTRLPVAEIAYACGFANQSHLTACFKQQFGTTPAQARREALL